MALLAMRSSNNDSMAWMCSYRSTRSGILSRVILLLSVFSKINEVNHKPLSWELDRAHRPPSDRKGRFRALRWLYQVLPHRVKAMLVLYISVPDMRHNMFGSFLTPPILFSYFITWHGPSVSGGLHETMASPARSVHAKTKQPLRSHNAKERKKVWYVTFADRTDIGVSKNRGTPKSSILIGFSIINHPFWGTPIFGNTHMVIIARCWAPLW